MDKSSHPFALVSDRPAKKLATITADLQLFKDGKPAESLSPTERLLAAYAVAEASAVALVEDGSLSKGHRNAVYAHFVSLMQRDGEGVASDFLAVLAGMVGADVLRHGIPYTADAVIEDSTDWSTAGLS